ncbi:uncharacterized protein B0J16DRAFT_367908 [Fusarium flagelliforme]|uniref:uncharacterized protein n=1 Tax=Fusarium flagelliforme TaxID=2675880 RepID=UPI001E8E0369|nr:uncharacterized protein B0J16DRAFT_367908 [Fusarium flagelliforme]KAH7198897.1 hypothetical protein B0J16DRAFT_367908 [Fusarium flagelliforme]
MEKARFFETLGYEPTGWDYDHVSDPDAPPNLEEEFENLQPHHGHNKISQLVAIPISDEEVEAAKKFDYAALDKGQDPSTVYPNIPDLNVQMQTLTITRPGECPSYLDLAKINWDHFGQDARTAYNACHSVALQVAASGDLTLAYAMNAFGDHFLQCSFASGHMRTPRRKLHDTTGAADLRAKFMHDEDNAIGLSNSVRASADEIYNAWKNKSVPEYPQYAAWNYAPVLSEVKGIVAPLFREDGQRRADIRKRCQSKYTNSYWYWSTALDLKASGLWDYPIEPTADCKI